MKRIGKTENTEQKMLKNSDDDWQQYFEELHRNTMDMLKQLTIGEEEELKEIMDSIIKRDNEIMKQLNELKI